MGNSLRWEWWYFLMVHFFLLPRFCFAQLVNFLFPIITNHDFLMKPASFFLFVISSWRSSRRQAFTWYLVRIRIRAIHLRSLGRYNVLFCFNFFLVTLHWWRALPNFSRWTCPLEITRCRWHQKLEISEDIYVSSLTATGYVLSWLLLQSAYVCLSTFTPLSFFITCWSDFTVRMFLIFSGLLMVHTLFLVQLIILA